MFKQECRCWTGAVLAYAVYPRKIQQLGQPLQPHPAGEFGIGYGHMLHVLDHELFQYIAFTKSRSFDIGQGNAAVPHFSQRAVAQFRYDGITGVDDIGW